MEQNEVVVTRGSRAFNMIVEADGESLAFVEPEDAQYVPAAIKRQLTSIPVCLNHNWMIQE